MKTGMYRDPNGVSHQKLNLPCATMGHPHLYNTPEEKKAAKATNSKQSYARFAIYSVPAQ